jgi:hypothetical protein
MASSTSFPLRHAASARKLAREILAERRFHAAPVPRPLHGVLDTVGRLLESPLNALGELVEQMGSGLPGGDATVWGVLVLLVLILSALLARRGARRALAGQPRSAEIADSVSRMSAEELLGAATVAERDGRNGDAIRLLFRRGLILLLESERVTVAPSMLSAEVSRALGSAQFDALARSFDEVAYGGRSASAQDVAACRSEWTALLKTVRA